MYVCMYVCIYVKASPILCCKYSYLTLYMRNWETERLGYLPKVIQLVSRRVKAQTQVFNPVLLTCDRAKALIVRVVMAMERRVTVHTLYVAGIKRAGEGKM